MGPKCIVIAAAAMLLALLYGRAEGIILGYTTGNDYLQMQNQARQIWLLGAMDGIMAEDLEEQIEGKEPAKAPWLGDCIEGLEFMQIKAIFEKALRSQPEAWHAPAALIFRDRLHKFCVRRQ